MTFRDLFEGTYGFEARVMAACLLMLVLYCAWLWFTWWRARRADSEVKTARLMVKGFEALKPLGCRIVNGGGFSDCLVSAHVDCRCAICRSWHERHSRTRGSVLFESCGMPPEDLQ